MLEKKNTAAVCYVFFARFVCPLSPAATYIVQFCDPVQENKIKSERVLEAQWLN